MRGRGGERTQEAAGQRDADTRHADHQAVGLGAARRPQRRGGLSHRHRHDDRGGARGDAVPHVGGVEQRGRHARVPSRRVAVDGLGEGVGADVGGVAADQRQAEQQHKRREAREAEAGQDHPERRERRRAQQPRPHTAHHHRDDQQADGDGGVAEAGDAPPALGGELQLLHGVEVDDLVRDHGARAARHTRHHHAQHPPPRRRGPAHLRPAAVRLCQDGLLGGRGGAGAHPRGAAARGYHRPTAVLIPPPWPAMAAQRWWRALWHR